MMDQQQPEAPFNRGEIFRPWLTKNEPKLVFQQSMATDCSQHSNVTDMEHTSMFGAPPWPPTAIQMPTPARPQSPANMDVQLSTPWDWKHYPTSTLPHLSTYGLQPPNNNFSTNLLMPFEWQQYAPLVTSHVPQYSTYPPSPSSSHQPIDHGPQSQSMVATNHTNAVAFLPPTTQMPQYPLNLMISNNNYNHHISQQITSVPHSSFWSQPPATFASPLQQSASFELPQSTIYNPYFSHLPADTPVNVESQLPTAFVPQPETGPIVEQPPVPFDLPQSTIYKSLDSHLPADTPVNVESQLHTAFVPQPKNASIIKKPQAIHFQPFSAIDSHTFQSQFTNTFPRAQLSIGDGLSAFKVYKSNATTHSTKLDHQCLTSSSPQSDVDVGTVPSPNIISHLQASFEARLSNTDENQSANEESQFLCAQSKASIAVQTETTLEPELPSTFAESFDNQPTTSESTILSYIEVQYHSEWQTSTCKHQEKIDDHFSSLETDAIVTESHNLEKVASDDAMENDSASSLAKSCHLSDESGCERPTRTPCKISQSDHDQENSSTINSESQTSTCIDTEPQEKLDDHSSSIETDSIFTESYNLEKVASDDATEYDATSTSTESLKSSEQNITCHLSDESACEQPIRTSCTISQSDQVQGESSPASSTEESESASATPVTLTVMAPATRIPRKRGRPRKNDPKVPKVVIPTASTLPRKRGRPRKSDSVVIAPTSPMHERQGLHSSVHDVEKPRRKARTKHPKNTTKKRLRPEPPTEPDKLVSSSLKRKIGRPRKEVQEESSSDEDTDVEMYDPEKDEDTDEDMLINWRKKGRKDNRLNRYTISEKLRMIKLAKSIGNRAAARHFEVDEKRIREWRKNEDMLKKQPKEKCRLPGGGKKVIDQMFEEKLKEFVKQLQANGDIITIRVILNESNRLWNELSKVNPELPEFKNSNGHVSRFCARHKIVMTATKKAMRKAQQQAEKDQRL